MSISYEKIKKYVWDGMSKEYLDGSVVTVKYINGHCPDNKLNGVPWKNDGEILPVYYRFYQIPNDNTKEPKLVKMPRGYQWLIKYISDSKKRSEPSILPAAFIYLFARDLLDRKEYDNKKELSFSIKETNELVRYSQEELLSNGYSIPDHRCRRFLDANFEVLLCIARGKKHGERLIAELVLSSIKNMTHRYILVEERYPDEEYDKAETLLKKKNENIAKHVSNIWSIYRSK